MRQSWVRQLWREPDFRRLLLVRLVGQGGDGLFQGALFGAAFFNPNRATSAREAAVAFTVLLLPYSLVGPFAGVLLDRWSRQRVLLLANALRAGVVLGLAAALAHDGPTAASTVTLALVSVSLNRFVLSGLSASLPHVVADRALITANSFTTTLGTAAAAVGGVTSLGLRETWGKGDSGAAAIAVLAALVYLAASCAATRISRQRLGPTLLEAARHSLVKAALVAGRELADGVRHVRRTPAAERALLAIAAHRFFSGLAFVMVLLLYTPNGYLHSGFGALGQVLTAVVFGGLIAAVLTPRFARRVGKQRWIVVMLTSAAAVMLVLFPPYQHWSIVVAGVGLGVASQATKICVDTLVQESIEDGYRGRVFSVYDTLFNLSFVAAAVTAAFVVPDNGRSLSVVVVVAGGYLATAACYAVLSAARAPGSQAPSAGP